MLEDESEWKSTIEQQTGQLQGAVAEILRALNLPALEKYALPDGQESLTSPVEPHGEPHIKLQSPQTSPHSNNSDARRHQQALAMAMTRENSQEPPGAEPEADTAPLVAAPMSSLFEVTKLRNLRSNLNGHAHGPDQTVLQEDFISQGKVSLDEAEWLFRIFSGKLAAYLWGSIPLVHHSLTATRASSPLLTAAILAVGALHVPGKEDVFDVCYSEFLHIVSSSMFDRYHSLDDVRGLCIGAFWLSDVSWKLSGHAVRIATELNLHQSFSKALRGDEEQIERARLWYLLYVCDHHFSIAYGRPPVIDQDTSITCHELFLQLPGITNADTRLHSQVGVFLILSKIFMTFGPDSSKELSHQDFRAIAQFNADLNTWKVTWEPRLGKSVFLMLPCFKTLLADALNSAESVRGLLPCKGCPSALPLRPPAAQFARAERDYTFPCNDPFQRAARMCKYRYPERHSMPQARARGAFYSRRRGRSAAISPHEYRLRCRVLAEDADAVEGRTLRDGRRHGHVLDRACR